MKPQISGKTTLSLADLQAVADEAYRARVVSHSLTKHRYARGPKSIMPFDCRLTDGGISYWGGIVYYLGCSLEVGTAGSWNDAEDTTLSAADGSTVTPQWECWLMVVPGQPDDGTSESDTSKDESDSESNGPMVRVIGRAPTDDEQQKCLCVLLARNGRQMVHGNVVMPPSAQHDTEGQIAGVVAGVDYYSATAVESPHSVEPHITGGVLYIPYAEQTDASAVDDVSAVSVAGVLRTAAVVTYDPEVTAVDGVSAVTGPTRAELHDGNLTIYVPEGGSAGTAVGCSFGRDVSSVRGEVVSMTAGSYSDGFKAADGAVQVPRAYYPGASAVAGGVSAVAGLLRSVSVVTYGAEATAVEGGSPVAAVARGIINDGDLTLYVPEVGAATAVGCTFGSGAVTVPGFVSGMSDGSCSEGWCAMDGAVQVPRANCTPDGASIVAGLIKGICVESSGTTPVGYISDGALHLDIPSTGLAQDGTPGMIRGVRVVEGGLADTTSATIEDGVITIVIRNLSNI